MAHILGSLCRMGVLSLHESGFLGDWYSGYMGTIPAAWHAELGGPAITGNCCLSIVSRTSFGPAAFSFNPESLGAAHPLVYYTQAHQTLGKYGDAGSHPVFNGTTRITGVIFPEGTASVLFFGMTGTGHYCYGEAADCGDDTTTAKGEHGAPYKAYVWAYDARDLARVKAGSTAPWAVVPYQTWALPAIGDVGLGSIGGAAYDPATGRIFVSQKNGHGELPVVHVFNLQ